MSSSRPLKIGLLIDDFNTDYWMSRIVDFVCRDSRTDLALVVVNAEVPPPRRTLWQKLRKNNFLYHRYLQFEQRYYRRELAEYSPAQDVASQLSAVPRLDVVPEGQRFVHRFSDEDVASIEAHELDVLVRFGFKILRGPILEAAKYGIWSYHHGDNDQYRGGPAGFWEVFENNPRTGVILQSLTESLDGGRVLGKTEIRTAENSPTLNATRIHLAGIRLFEDAIGEVSRGSYSKEEFLEVFQPSSIPYEKEYYTRPTNLQMLRYLTCNLSVKFCKKVADRKRKREQWFVGVGEWHPDRFPSKPIAGVRWLYPDDESFIADGFPIERDGKTWLFVEQYRYDRGQGRIVAIDPDDPQSLREPQTCMDLDFHLSFPFLFEHDRELFMLPEQMEADRLSLYCCREFPDRWEEVAVLLENVRCVDSVVHFHDGKWWLWCSRDCEGFSSNNLYLYTADDLFGPWEPHVDNPLKNSLCGSRMAGKIFQLGEKLIRPGQDCTESYGGGLVFYEIESLTLDSYREREIGRLSPSDIGSSESNALHTINVLGDRVYVDGRRWRRWKKIR